MHLLLTLSLALPAGALALVVAGLLSPADLWPPAIAGVVTSPAVSLIAGLPSGPMSGLMGGTMGAMAAWMMTTRGHGGHDGMEHEPQATRPLALAAVITLVAGVGAWAAVSLLPAPQAHQHGAVASMAVLARNFAFSPATLTLEYGQPSSAP